MGNFPETMVWTTKAWDWVKLRLVMLLGREGLGGIEYINAENESDFRL